MQLTRAADYAVRVMVHLATLPPESRVQLAELSQAAEVPSSFVAKVLQRLVRAGLVASRRGMKGGFELTVVGRESSLLNVVEAMEGPIRLNVCIGDGPTCSQRRRCAAHPVWLEAQQAVVTVLRSTTVERLAHSTPDLPTIMPVIATNHP